MLSIGQLKSNAKTHMKGSTLALAGLLFVADMLISLSSCIIVGPFLFGGPFELGATMCSADISEGKKGEFDLVFKGFNRFGDSLAAYLLRDVFIALWSLLFIIPGIVKSYSYAMTFFILRDNPALSTTQAITKSREMMNGHKGKLFLMDLSFIGWELLSLFTFGILGIFYVRPYRNVAYAEFYQSLKANMPAAPEATAA